jgi:hypothetical protein
MRRLAMARLIVVLIVIALVVFFIVKTTHGNNICPAGYGTCGGYVHVDPGIHVDG